MQKSVFLCLILGLILSGCSGQLEGYVREPIGSTPTTTPNVGTQPPPTTNTAKRGIRVTPGASQLIGTTLSARVSISTSQKLVAGTSLTGTIRLHTH